MLELNKIHHGDCLELMRLIPDKSIDLVLTDPPYFGIVKDEWDNQRDNREKFIERLEECAKQWKRILKDNGSIYVFGDDKVIAYVQVMMDKYFKLENNIIRHKPNNMTIKGWNQYRSYSPVTERLLFYSNEIVNINGISVYKSRDYIRENILKVKGKIVLKEINKVLGTADNGGGVASACLSLDKGEPAMITEEHFIKIFQRLYPAKEYEELRKEYEELRRPFNPATNYTDVRQFNIITQIESSQADHPTQKPIDIIKRIIDTSSREGDVILDSFLGSGTTAIACKELGRNFIGIEKEQKYVDIANKRLATTTVSLFN